MKTTILSLLMGLLMTGCQEDLPQTAQIEKGKESLSFAQGSGTRTVKITASHSWTAVSSGSWLTVSPDKGGAGTHELTLTAAANSSGSSRTAEVNIQVGHKISTVKVSQAQKDALGLDRNSEVVAWTAGSVEFTLSTNVTDYEVSSDADWLQPSLTKAMTDQTLVLAYEENTTYEERTGTVTVSNGALTSSVKVTQGGRGALYFVIARAEVAASDTQYEVVLMKNTQLSGLHLLDEAPWITLPPDTRAMPEEERFRLTLQANMATEPREARLVIRDESTGVLLTDTFTLVQRGLENQLLIETDHYEVVVEGETFDIPVTASGPFEVILPEDAPWLTGSTGIQLAGTLRFAAEANTRPEPRQAVIVLRLQSEIPVEATITVTQPAAEVADVDRIPRLYNLLELGTVIETNPVNLGAFRATVGYDSGEPTGWVNEIYTNSGKLHFRVEENNQAVKRSATIRLSLDNGAQVDIRINQSGSGQAYLELETPGTLASFIDYSNKEHYQSIRLRANNGINADDINTLTNTTLAIEEMDLSEVVLTELPEGVFKDNRTLRRIVLPKGLQKIGAEAFYNCKHLSGTLKLPASLVELGERAFMKCRALEELDLSVSRLSVIGAEAFKESFTAPTAQKLAIPSGVTAIAAGAFEDTGFTEVDLPATLTAIGREAFYNCRNLSVVSCRRTENVPLLDATYPGETFGGIGIGGERILKVDAASIDLYTNDPQWILATPATGGVVWKMEGI